MECQALTHLSRQPLVQDHLLKLLDCLLAPCFSGWPGPCQAALNGLQGEHCEAEVQSSHHRQIYKVCVAVVGEEDIGLAFINIVVEVFLNLIFLGCYSTSIPKVISMVSTGHQFT